MILGEYLNFFFYSMESCLFMGKVFKLIFWICEEFL